MQSLGFNPSHETESLELLTNGVEQLTPLIKVSKAFSQDVVVKNLTPGRLYEISFSAVNQKDEKGPPSKSVRVFTLPEVPDVQIRHAGDYRVRIKWGVSSKTGHEDSYSISYAKVRLVRGSDIQPFECAAHDR